jgi:hypothetical protein
VICTVGGTISGYCATGRITRAPRPTSVRKTLRTVARIGLSMKTCMRRMMMVLGILFGGKQADS